VDDIVTFMETVKNVGGEVITSIKENHWGAIECLFKDPNGYNLIAYEMIT
jgi:predicted enzyme related to lactoylglutathione lyase